MTPVVLTGQPNEFVLVSNSVKNLNRATINDIIQNTPGGNTIGIDPDNAATFHTYEVRTGVCLTTNLNCTIENVFEALKRYPAPGATGEPVYNGATTDIIVGPRNLGPVVHYLDPDGHSVTNVTTSGHQLYPGIVFRQVYQDGELISVQSIGFGNGPNPRANEILADTIWGGRNAVDIIDYISGLTGANPYFVPINYTPSSGDTEFQLAVYKDGSLLSSEDNGIIQHTKTSSANGAQTDKYVDTGGIQPWSSETWTKEINGYLKSHQTVLDAGNKYVEEFDTRNSRLWEDRVFGMDSTGNVTAVQVRLNGETTTRSSASPVDFSAIGQIFGSAIGRAIVGKDGNPFALLTAGTVAGFVGQKFVQALINGPGAIDLANLDISDVFFGQQVSLAGAGLGVTGGPHLDRSRRVKAERAIRGSGWRRAKRAGTSMTCVRKRFA